MHNFIKGFDAAIKLWRDGITWEAITWRADELYRNQAFYTSRGMVAAVEAMSGAARRCIADLPAEEDDAEPTVSIPLNGAKRLLAVLESVNDSAVRDVAQELRGVIVAQSVR